MYLTDTCFIYCTGIPKRVGGSQFCFKMDLSHPISKILHSNDFATLCVKLVILLVGWQEGHPAHKI